MFGLFGGGPVAGLLGLEGGAEGLGGGPEGLEGGAPGRGGFLDAAVLAGDNKKLCVYLYTVAYTKYTEKKNKTKKQFSRSHWPKNGMSKHG